MAVAETILVPVFAHINTDHARKARGPSPGRFRYASQGWGMGHALSTSTHKYRTQMQTNQTYFIFDVESIGLHGEGFAVAGGIYSRDRKCLKEFAFHCDGNEARGTDSDREWIAANVTVHPSSILEVNPQSVRSAFWTSWMIAKLKYGAVMFVECGWPVEAAFLEACIDDDPEVRNWEGPYPMHEIASFIAASGLDPMATYERMENELPSHEPLADARQSARMLFDALDKLGI